MIPYGRQSISDADVAAVAAALRGEWLTQGPTVARFEEALARAVGARFAVAFNSGTAALHAAYAAAGVGPGRDVITAPITFAATANAARYLGGDVHFVDVDAEHALMDPEAVAALDVATARVLAPVHLAGHVAPMHALAALACERGWLVVEDAAHALGARYTDADGREHRVGSCAHSAMCCFSFHPVKHITTLEGGAVTTNDPALAHALRRFRTHGITRDPAELTVDEGAWYYEQHELGFNYRLPDVACALGLSQLERLDAFVARRREVAAAYDAAFGGREELAPLREPAWSRGSYHLYVIRVPAAHRRAIFDRLRADGLGVNVHYLPVYRHPYYRRTGFAGTHLPRAEAYYASAISLPMHAELTARDVAEVIATVERVATPLPV